MITNVGQTVIRFTLFGIMAFVFSCQKSDRLHSSPTATHQSKTTIEADLTPTSSFEDSDEPIVKDGVTYQAPQKKIKNTQSQTELLVGRVKLDKSKIIYNQETRKLRITGIARVLDESRNEIGSTDFDIDGLHNADEGRFLLKESNTTKFNSSEKPLVRAKVSCLSLNEKDEYDCSHSVIDFFISFKKQKYTEQMELTQKNKKPEPPTVPIPPTPPPPDAKSADGADDSLQTEGTENSLDGRYQGHAETVDLKKVFEGDQDDDVPVQPPVTTNTPPVVIAPTPPAPVPTTTGTSTPPRIPPPTPATATSTPPLVTAPITPTPPATPPDGSGDKKEKQLTKDLQQLKNGDVRQINQSIGFPDNGNLRNSTSLLTKQQALNDQAFFEVVNPGRNRHFGTYEVAEMISRIGKDFAEISSHKLYIGNVSQKTGGKVYSLDRNGKILYDGRGNPILAHASHQAGVDVDVAYPTRDEKIKFPVVVDSKNGQYNSSIYSTEQTFAILKFAFSQPDIKIDRIFMDIKIKKALCEYAKSKNEFNSSNKDLMTAIFNSIDHVDGHGDHFHIRLKCSSYDPACRQKIYAVNKGCN